MLLPALRVVHVWRGHGAEVGVVVVVDGAPVATRQVELNVCVETNTMETVTIQVITHGWSHTEAH